MDFISYKKYFIRLNYCENIINNFVHTAFIIIYILNLNNGNSIETYIYFHIVIFITLMIKCDL